MHGTYLQNKASVDRWRDKNKNGYNTYHRKYHSWKKIRLEFFNILIDI